MGVGGGSLYPAKLRARLLPIKGLAGCFPWERGRLARKTEFAAGRGLDARDTLTLALSHEGRGDPLTAIRAWFRAASLIRQPRVP